MLIYAATLKTNRKVILLDNFDTAKPRRLSHITVCDNPQAAAQHTSTITATYALVYLPRLSIIPGLPASLLLAVHRFIYNPNATVCFNMAISLAPKFSKKCRVDD